METKLNDSEFYFRGLHILSYLSLNNMKYADYLFDTYSSTHEHVANFQ